MRLAASAFSPEARPAPPAPGRAPEAPDASAPLLVRLPNWLGDLVLAWPVVEAAAGRAAVFVGPAAWEPMLAGRFPRSPYLAWSRSRRYALVRPLRALRPRAALLLTESFSSALLAALAGIPRRIGYGGEGRGLLLTKRVPRAGDARSTARAAEYRFLAEAAGVHAAGEGIALRATPMERAAGQERLRAEAAAGAGAAELAGARYAVIAPGAAYGPAKQWGAARFAAAAAHLARRHGALPVIVGSSEDRPAAEAVARGLEGARSVNLVGRTTLTELVGILDRAAAVVSNDSGVMHLAAALGRPTVGVFGSTSPVWTAASAPWVASLYASYPCSPCFRRTCPIGYGCLESIAAEEGIEAVDRLLAAGASEGGSGAASGGQRSSRV